MVISDPIGDMLTRIRNAQVAKHDTVTLPAGANVTTWYSIAAMERRVSETSRVEVTRTAWPAGERHSATRERVPARRSSSRSCCSTWP